MAAPSKPRVSEVVSVILAGIKLRSILTETPNQPFLSCLAYKSFYVFRHCLAGSSICTDHLRTAGQAGITNHGLTPALDDRQETPVALPEDLFACSQQVEGLEHIVILVEEDMRADGY